MKQPRRRVVGRSVIGVALAVGTLSVSSGPAQAEVNPTPARTWGIGPAAATSASVGVPRVSAIQPIGDRIFVAGTFSSIIDPSGTSYPTKNLAVFSATTGAADLSFLGGANNTITSMTTDGNGTLYLGGTFGTVNGSVRKGLAALEASTGHLLPWNPSVVAPGQVDAVTYSDGSVYAGGNFAGVSSSAGTSGPYLAKLGATSAEVDTAWTPSPNNRVRAVHMPAADATRLFVAGDFTSMSARSSTNKLAAVSATGAGAVDPTFKAGPTNAGAFAPIFDLTSDAERIYTATAGSGGACAALDVATGALRWSDHSNGNMQGVRLLGGQLYCAGHYGGTNSFLGQVRNKLAAVDPATGALYPYAPNVDSSQGPWALAVDATHLYLGGDFSQISGVAQPHFAMFLDSTITTVPQGPTRLLAGPGNNVVHLSWSAPSSDGGSGLVKYKIYRSLTSGGQNLSKAAFATLGKDTRTYDDTTAVNDTMYYYTVIAGNALGSSPAATESSAQPSAAYGILPPGAPTYLSATTPAGYNALQWNPPTDNGGAPITGYQVFRATTPGGQDLSAPIASVSTTSFKDVTDVVAGVHYYYVVKAVNQAGAGSASSEVAATLTPGTPGPPVLSGELTAARTVQLSWTVPPDGGSVITKYSVLREGVRMVNLTVKSGGPTSWTDTNPPSGSPVYQVRAANAYGNGQLSNRFIPSVP